MLALLVLSKTAICEVNHARQMNPAQSSLLTEEEKIEVAKYAGMNPKFSYADNIMKIIKYMINDGELELVAQYTRKRKKAYRYKFIIDGFTYCFGVLVFKKFISLRVEDLHYDNTKTTIKYARWKISYTAHKMNNQCARKIIKAFMKNDILTQGRTVISVQ